MSYQKLSIILNNIPNVCILIQNVMSGLTDLGAESVAPNAGGVVRVPSTVSARPPVSIQEFDRWMGRPSCVR
jgi:hypothetical protein